MSVLIEGMEMPKNCGECLLAKLSPTGESLICNYMLSRVSWEERPFDCPLTPVPPHGRLIEKNAVFELIRSFPNVDRQLPVEFMKALYELPTVIGAEEGE